MPFIGHKTARIYNGIDFNAPLYSADIVRHSFPKGVHITGTIGELTRNKNQIALIEEGTKKIRKCMSLLSAMVKIVYFEEKDRRIWNWRSGKVNGIPTGQHGIKRI